MTRRVTLTEDTARRMAAATRVVERGSRDQTAVKFRQPGSENELVWLGKISSTWLKGATKTVIKLKADGSVQTPEFTFQAVNYFTDISVDCGDRKVCCADIGGTWVLIAAEC